MPKHMRLTTETLALLRSDKTAKQIALLLGVSKRTVTFQRAKLGMQKRFPINWPTDPEWYRVRTVGDMLKEIPAHSSTIVNHLKKHGYEYCKGRWTDSKLTGRRLRNNRAPIFKYNWPTDPAWYTQRSARQIANYIGCTIEVVRSTLRKRGYTCKMVNVFPDWPTDPAWYADKTAKEIAAILHIHHIGVRARLKKHGIAYKSMARRSYTRKPV